MILSALQDAVIDTVKLIPFLFVTYLVMEYIEHKAEGKSASLLEKSGKFGPVIGALIGVVPQCGFSAAAASLFSGGVITLGTLIAVFLSTSDEMLPIFISEAVAPLTIIKILGTKILLGLISGFFVDYVIRHEKHTHDADKHIHDLCEREHCACEENEDGILMPAFRHTVQITAFIFVITFLITVLIEGIGEEAIGSFLANKPVVGVFLTGIVGLIPNCASSVTITELYLLGILNAGQMMSGLLVGAGVGLLVLFRTNDHPNENLKVLMILYFSGVFWGLLIEQMGIAF